MREPLTRRRMSILQKYRHTHRKSIWLLRIAINRICFSIMNRNSLAGDETYSGRNRDRHRMYYILVK